MFEAVKKVQAIKVWLCVILYTTRSLFDHAGPRISFCKRHLEVIILHQTWCWHLREIRRMRARSQQRGRETCEKWALMIAMEHAILMELVAVCLAHLEEYACSDGGAACEGQMCLHEWTTGPWLLERRKEAERLVRALRNSGMSLEGVTRRLEVVPTRRVLVRRRPRQ